MNFSPRQREASSHYQLAGDVLYLSKAFDLSAVDHVLPQLLRDLRGYPYDTLRINLDEVQRLDSAGVVVLQHIRKRMQEQGVEVASEGGSEAIRNVLETFAVTEKKPAEKPRDVGLLETIGHTTHHFFSQSLKNFFFLMSDIFYWSVADLFRSKTFRKGEFVNQAVLIGASAVGIVVAMAFLIGSVLALQSTAQLRQFGANRFIVDLIVIAMLREMGPLITAIIVAGRSGSAIASEIATMKITEELDGLTTMALNPVRFIVVPKMYASIFTMPFLTILADIVGIFGGMVIAFIYMDITPKVFLNRMEEVLIMRDIVTGFIKSLVFAGIIVLTGSFFGFRAERGASEVGQVTTSSVVAAIALVIIADSILGLLFY